MRAVQTHCQECFGHIRIKEYRDTSGFAEPKTRRTLIRTTKNSSVYPKLPALWACWLLVLSGCRGENKIYRIPTHSEQGTSLIGHPYVFEDEGWEINAFFVKADQKTETYMLHLHLVGAISEFAVDHRAFIHGFEEWNDSDKSVNRVLNNPKVYGDTLVFRTALPLKGDSLLQKVNFGLEDKITKKRKFVLTLKNVDLHNHQQ